MRYQVVRSLLAAVAFLVAVVKGQDTNSTDAEDFCLNIRKCFRTVSAKRTIPKQNPLIPSFLFTLGNDISYIQPSIFAGRQRFPFFAAC